MLGSTLMQSQRFRGLPSDTCRLGYIALHLSILGNYQGLWWHPPQMLAADLSIDMEEAQQVLSRLDESCLIDFDEDEQFVRIRGWHIKENRPQNQSVAMTRLGELADMKGPEWMRRATAAELFVGIGRALPKWNPEKEITDKLHRTLLREFKREAKVGPDWSRALSAAGLREEDEIIGSLMSHIQPEDAENATVTPLSAHRGGTA